MALTVSSSSSSPASSGSEGSGETDVSEGTGETAVPEGPGDEGDCVGLGNSEGDVEPSTAVSLLVTRVEESQCQCGGGW